MSSILLFPNSSALYALPRSFEAKEVLYLDGVRYACEMVHISYGRLCTSLEKLPYEDDPDLHRHLMTSGIHDAWSIIDAADRLRSLIERSEVLKELKNASSNFFLNADIVRKLRNVIQHIDTLIPNHASADWPVWGGVRWFQWKHAPRLGISCVMLAGGHATSRPFDLTEPHKNGGDSPVSSIFLFTKGLEVSLTDLHALTVALSASVEELVVSHSAAPEGRQERFADVFIQANIDFDCK